MAEEARERGCWGHPSFGPICWEGLILGEEAVCFILLWGSVKRRLPWGELRKAVFSAGLPRPVEEGAGENLAQLVPNLGMAALRGIRLA